MINFENLTFFWDLGAISLLLGVFLYTCFLLKRLSLFYKNRDELERILDAFSQSVTCAQASLSQLKEKTSKFEESLGGKIRTATTLLDDLSFFSDRGEKLIKELENEIRRARQLKQEVSKDAPQNHLEGDLQQSAKKQIESISSSMMPSSQDSSFLQATGLH